jgi:hypothetical protein
MFTENHKLTVPVLKSNVINLNGRMYTDECLNQMVAAFKENAAEGHPMFGELGYPDGRSFTSLDKVSHQITELYAEGDTLFAELTVLDTPKGEELKTMIGDIVFRPRLIGHVNDDSTVRINKLISFDAIQKETDSYKNLI